MLLIFICTILTRPITNVTTARGRLYDAAMRKLLNLSKLAGAVRWLQAKLPYRLSRLKQISGQLYLLVLKDIEYGTYALNDAI